MSYYITCAAVIQVFCCALPFFRSFVEKGQKLAPDRRNISFSIQTNGLLIDSDRADFFKENDFLVGLSMDGGSDIHNLNRRDRQAASGIGGNYFCAGYQKFFAHALPRLKQLLRSNRHSQNLRQSRRLE